MCGIFGAYATNFSGPESKLFRSLALLNVFRGEDGTGVIEIQERTAGKGKRRQASYPIKAFKTLKPSPSFLYSKEADFLMYGKDREFPIGLVGHCRAATVGKVTKENTHPFEFKDVVGVHNGTIEIPFKGSKDYDTDSEALYALINDVGIEKALNTLGDRSFVAYALVWVNKKDNTLNFVKNDKRPLWFTYLYGKSTLVWSSDRKHLMFAVQQGNHNPCHFNKPSHDKKDWESNFFTLEKHNLMSIPIGESPEKASIKKLDIKPSSSSYHGYGYGSWGGKFDDEWWRDRVGKANGHGGDGKGKDVWDGYEKVTTSGGGVYYRKVSTDGDRLQLPPREKGKYRGYRKKWGDKLDNLPWLEDATTKAVVGRHPLMSEKEFEFKLSRGCFSCGTVLSPTQTDELARIRWWDRDHHACGECWDGQDWVRATIEDSWDSFPA